MPPAGASCTPSSPGCVLTGRRHRHHLAPWRDDRQPTDSRSACPDTYARCLVLAQPELPSLSRRRECCSIISPRLEASFFSFRQAQSPSCDGMVSAEGELPAAGWQAVSQVGSGWHPGRGSSENIAEFFSSLSFRLLCQNPGTPFWSCPSHPSETRAS